MKGILPDLCPLDKPSHNVYLSYTLSYLLASLRQALISALLKSLIDQVVLPTEAECFRAIYWCAVWLLQKRRDINGWARHGTVLLKLCYGFVCPLSVGKHPGICTLKPMRNTGFQMWRYRIRSTRIFNLPLDSPSSPLPPLSHSPVSYISQCIFTVQFWRIIIENVTSKRLVCVATHVAWISILREVLISKRSW